MTVARPRLTFEEYLMYDDGTDNRYELIQGELVELPPESELNDFMTTHLFLLLISAKVVSPRLIKTHTCEIQVPVISPNDSANRYPDLVILRPEHLELTQKRLTITLDMPAPLLIAEVVSPGQSNRDRDYKNKRAQYARRAIPEYWIIDPESCVVTILKLESGQYVEIGAYRGSDRINSDTFANLQLTAEEIFVAE
jgi:Uma2 family endonuclease